MTTPWVQSGQGRPCPVCGTEGHGCLLHAAAGGVYCLHPSLRDTWDMVPGYKGLRAPLKDERGVLLVAEGAGDPERLGLPPGESVKERREAAAEAFRAEGIKAARAIWKRAAELGPAEDHPRIREYLAFRGIPLERLPGGRVPAALRYHPRCPDEPYLDDQKRRVWPAPGPAMLGRIVEVQELEGRWAFVQTGVHRTYLDPDGPGKRPGELEAKKMKGPAKGRGIWLRPREFPYGALVIGEGIETTLSVMAATGLSGIVGLSTEHIAGLEIPPGLVDPRTGPVATIIIAADLNVGAIGARGMERFRERVRELCPHLDRAEIDRMAALGAGERGAWIFRHRMAARYPWVAVEIRRPTGEACPRLVRATDAGDRPLEGRGCDWNDALASDGLEAVAAGVAGGIDLEGNLARARAWDGPIPAAPTPHKDEDGTRAGEDARGGGDGGGGGGKGPPPWAPRPPHDMPVLEEGPVVRARRYLWEQRRVPGQRRFGVAWWAGKWWQYDGRCYVEMDDVGMRSVLWHWLSGFASIKRKARVALNPTVRMAEEVVKALAIDTSVRADTTPAWMPPVIDESGKPMWGLASAVAPAAAAGESLVDPRTLLVFPNGVLSLARLSDRRLSIPERTRLERHSPELFNTTCLPFDLPVGELQALLRGEDRDDVFERLCPKFYNWMADASDGDSSWEDQLLKMLGDTVQADRSIEKIYGVVGLQRGGKGILEEAVTAIVGERNVGALNSMALTDRFGLAHLVGMRAAIMPDAHLDSFTQGSGATENLKAISGQGRIPIRDLYTRVTTHKLGCRIWIFMNGEPELKDNSGALAGRFVWLPIVKSYLGREDASIKASVPQEAPGIMLLALEGLLRLRAMGRPSIEMCGEGQEIARGFEEDSAPLRIFVQTWLEHPPQPPLEHNWPTADRLYQAYECFCIKEERRKPLGFRKFIKNLRWHARPWTYSQPRSPDGTRPRRLEGWRIREDKLDVLAEFTTTRQARPDDELPLDFPS